MSTILVQTHRFSQKIKGVFLPTALALFLSACTGSGFFQNEVTESLKNEVYATSEYYINQAAQSSKETQQSYLLLAIRQLIAENKIQEAAETMRQIRVAELNQIQRIEHQLLSAQLSARQNRNQQATIFLKQLPKLQLSQAQLQRFYLTQAQIAENQKEVLESVRARAWLDSYLTDNRQRQENNNKIWEMLRNANRGMLENAQAGMGEVALAGWLALAVSYNQNITNPMALPHIIQNWKSQYPTHSAAQIMPTELQGIVNFQQTQLHNLALLLPLSGETKILGEIIKKGFDDAKGKEGATVQVYDTNTASVVDIVNQAKQQGIQMIVGPLLKSRLDELMMSQALGDINVLALNATSNIKAINQVCYYGLSPEAEARSAAERIAMDRMAQAIVIAPQDDFGYRSSEAFAQRWRQLTNRDADVRYYRQPLDVMGVLENSASRNSALYLLGNPQQLQELKLALNNAHLSEKFALYSSSRSNSPNNGPDFRLAMEGVKFSEIPLLATNRSEMYKKVENLAESDFSMMRLYAMGADAWSIANKFNEFRQIPGYKVSGLTGVLSAGTNCNIEREMTWLQYQNGTITPAN